MTVLALDIGGANLKAADGLGMAASRPFALWQRPADLAAELGSLIAAAPPAERLAVTMTGELADCYATKREGVAAIVAAAQQAAGGREVLIYLTDGTFVPPDEAVGRAQEAAASNWHALASFAAELIEGDAGLLFDVGSTTCDVVPIVARRPAPRGKTDPARLQTGELIYAGIERTPVMAVVRQLPWGDVICPVAAELFATTKDVYLLLGELAEDSGDRQTADGRPATRACAQARMARMVCADSDAFTMADAEAAALATVKALELHVAEAVRKVVFAMRRPPGTIVVSGHGEFLARRVLARLHLPATVVSLTETLGPGVSRVAPAHALAALARRNFAKRSNGCG